MNILYKIYYGAHVVYLGRTRQPLNNRLRGHFLGKPMHKAIDINAVTRIEYAELSSVADMYVYEVYYINLLKPHINCDDRAGDDMTIALPELDWRAHQCHLMDKWKAEMAARTSEYHRERRRGIEVATREWERQQRLGGDAS